MAWSQNGRDNSKSSDYRQISEAFLRGNESLIIHTKNKSSIAKIEQFYRGFYFIRAKYRLRNIVHLPHTKYRIFGLIHHKCIDHCFLKLLENLIYTYLLFQLDIFLI